MTSHGISHLRMNETPSLYKTNFPTSVFGSSNSVKHSKLGKPVLLWTRIHNGEMRLQKHDIDITTLYNKFTWTAWEFKPAYGFDTLALSPKYYSNMRIGRNRCPEGDILVTSLLPLAICHWWETGFTGSGHHHGTTVASWRATSSEMCAQLTYEHVSLLAAWVVMKHTLCMDRGRAFDSC